MVFGGGRRNSNAALSLLNMRQESQSVADYAIDFRTRASQCDWHPSGLCDVFRHGLAPYMKDELAIRKTPPTLDRVIELATHIDVRIRERWRERLCEGRVQSPTFRPREFRALAEASHPDETEAMQLGRTSLSSAERDRRRRSNLCLYCGPAGTLYLWLPVKRQRSPVKRELLVSNAQLKPPTPVRPLIQDFFCHRVPRPWPS